MCNFQADAWPTMSATEPKIHEPKRKMHGKLQNCIKLLENCWKTAYFAPSGAPRRSLFTLTYPSRWARGIVI